MPKLLINDIEINVAPGTSVLQAAQGLGFEIPHFCYHKLLSVPANCRMCLVDIKGTPRPAPSCATPCAEGMVVHTDSQKTTKARKGVMEFLLINHPLDCPVCDQGGECDLQDQAVGYGFDRSRFEENKRTVTDKDLGPLIKTVMTRCIHCTRCIRFADEIAGVSEMGAIGRGEDMEIVPYLQATVTSELSGNMIDLCPVGALTSKPYAFKARSWELENTDSIDIMDAVGSHIRVDTRNAEVMRILPRTKDDLNEEWISDKARFSYDGLKQQRLDRPYIRKNGSLEPATWEEAFAAIQKQVKKCKGTEMAALAGDLCEAESLIALKDLMQNLGCCNRDCRQNGAEFDVTTPAGYLFNTTIAGLEKADALLLIGTNLRWEAPLVNARIRKAFSAGGLKNIGSIGPSIDLTYRVTNLGDDPAVLKQILDGKHAFSKILNAAKHPVLIAGMGAFQGSDGLAIHHLLYELAEKFGCINENWNGFNLLHEAASQVGALMLGFVSGKNTRQILKATQSGTVKFLYLLGADDIDFTALSDQTFVVYQGHHGDQGALRADVILPGAAYTEKDGTYLNIEGRVQRTKQAVPPPGDAKEDWKIIRALSDVLNKKLPYDTLDEVRARLNTVNDIFTHTDTITPAKWQAFGQKGAIKTAALSTPIKNYYMTNAICRASEIMAECGSRGQ